jgi:glycosyltransferase involved in cell wall biosynthesis
MAVPGWLAARRTGAAFVYDAHELMVPEPGVPQPVRERIWYLGERAVVGRAELVIAANAERAELMARHYGLGRTPLAIANITPAPATVAPASQVARRYPSLAPEAAAVRLVYQGDMNLERGVDEFLRALTRLPARFRLVMVGGGPDLERLRRMAGELGVEARVSFLGRVARDDLDGIMRACQVGLITYPRQGLNNLYCAPNKVYEYAQAGLPSFGRENPVLRRLIADSGIGVVDADVLAGVQAVVAGLERFRAAIPAFLGEHTWEDQATRLLAAYQALTGPGPGTARSAAGAPGAAPLALYDR